MASIEIQFEEVVQETDVKPATFGPSSFLKRAVRFDASDSTVADIESYRSALANMNACAFILEYMPDPVISERLSEIISTVRQFERETGKPMFVIMSYMKYGTGDFRSDAFREFCKYTYMKGLDAVLLRPSQPEDIQFIREECMGLRGRRVKILVEETRSVEVIQVCDGVFVNESFSSAECEEILKRQKLVFTNCPSLTDSQRADMLVSPHVESFTPPTTEPTTPIGSPLSSSMESRAQLRPKSFLFTELLKFVRYPSTSLIIALSDDGASAAELSIQSRLQKRRIPPILALTAAESVYRYMGCLFGVVPLRMQSFVSVATVINNALLYAKEKGMVKLGDAVVVVLNPPPVTASTNESCFESVVQARIVE